MYQLETTEHQPTEDARSARAAVPPARTARDGVDDDSPWGVEDHIIRGID